MTDKITDWQTLNLQSLDIILCSGSGKMSQQIQWLQRLRGFVSPASDISHAAMIVRVPTVIAEVLDTSISPSGIYVNETTTLNNWPKPPKKGLQINDFEGWLENYNGKVWIRQVQSQVPPLNNQHIVRFIFDHLRDKDAQFYENGIPGLLELFLCEIGWNKAVLQTAKLHCTEWISELLRQFQVITNAYSGNRLPPVEWWPLVCKKNGTCRPSLLEQQALVKIGVPIRIK
ncbi:MAG: hypothetical protein WCY05_01885 [Candidatus Omnitrophota bacterium]